MDLELRSLLRELDAGNRAVLPRLAATLFRMGRGWNGEDLPLGMRLAPIENRYLWSTGRGFELEMFHVPAGDFLMGEPQAPGAVLEPWERVSRPQHLHPMPNAFWMMRAPTTFIDFRRFLASSGYRPPQKCPEARAGFEYRCLAHEEGKEGHEHAVSTYHFEARAFCRWVGLRLPERPSGGRLPPSTRWRSGR